MTFKTHSRRAGAVQSGPGGRLARPAGAVATPHGRTVYSYSRVKSYLDLFYISALFATARVACARTRTLGMSFTVFMNVPGFVMALSAVCVAPLNGLSARIPTERALSGHPAGVGVKANAPRICGKMHLLGAVQAPTDGSTHDNVYADALSRRDGEAKPQR